jgi:two-component system cell cycle response regulator DivK
VPDVILMDLRLPDMDGVDATRKLAAHERTALIPVVAMSASPLEGSEDWLEEAGFDGWLEKPIHVSTFPEQVRRYGAERAE